MSDPVVIPGEPDTTVIEPDTVIVEANPTIIVPAAPEPEPEPEPQSVVETCHCLTVEQFEEVMRRVIADMAVEEEIPELEPEPPKPSPKPSEHDTPPEPSHPFFRRRGGKR